MDSVAMVGRPGTGEERPHHEPSTLTWTRFGLLWKRVWTSMRSGYVPRCMFSQSNQQCRTDREPGGNDHNLNQARRRIAPCLTAHKPPVLLTLVLNV
ncbi:hypothetical protein L210DRAFT_597461 [Boletus edulis BED1]|uniref:Uncharacterized protein n=1 Tax=Boletus edulis BED1 TaxID=1328754 RepID=A0AAD4BZ64_BOLED|nr:hypothetical protein L210DRAFT_597461 [Boletus edulis BED1]